MKLIDKAAVVAEIEKRFDEYSSSILKHYDACTEARASELGKILVILNTLEVKEVDLESLVRQVIDLYLEAGEHYNSVIKEERKEHGGSDLAIKLLGGVIDAKELSIQYVLNKFKVQKGE